MNNIVVVLIVSDPRDSEIKDYAVIGPFKNSDEAEDWATYKRPDNSCYYITTLTQIVRD